MATKLNPKKEKFCQLYATEKEFFCNGVQSYIEAYKPDQSKPNWYKTARQQAYRLLTNVGILRRIDELIELDGMNDSYVDKQLGKLIQQDAEFGIKLGAIKEYNVLKERIKNKFDILNLNDFIDKLNGEKPGTSKKQAVEDKPSVQDS